MPSRKRPDNLVLTPEQQRVVERLRKLARLMDSQYRLPGTRIRIGWDGILGLAPVVGDLATMGVSAYIIFEAQKLGVSRVTTGRMIGNVLLDYLVGEIPILGDVFDVAFKANIRNLRLLGIDSQSSSGYSG